MRRAPEQPQAARCRLRLMKAAFYRQALGLIADGRIGEVILDCDRPDSLSAALARDAAILASVALQHGAPIATLRHALTRGSDGRAAGPLGRALDLLEEGLS